MKSTIDAVIGEQLVSWVTMVQRRPKFVLGTLIAVTALFATTAILKLGINSNNLDLVSPELASRIHQAEFSAVFPDIENALLVVVDSDSPQQTQDAVSALTQRFKQLPERIESVYTPNGGDFFAQQGLLYLQLQELRKFGQQLQQLRPLLISLEADPSVGALADLVVKNMRVTRFNFDYEATWEPLIDRLIHATQAVLEKTEIPYSASLQQQLLPTVKNLPFRSSRQVMVVNPVLEFGNILAAQRTINSIRSVAQDLGYDGSPSSVKVRITGNPALNLEEMIGIAWDIGVAGIFCFCLVIVVLIFALRSIPLVIVAVSTLLVGLVWTAGLAAVFVGHLNIVSIAVAILFIGLGVDFAIHLGMSYADSLSRGSSEAAAMRDSVSKIGSSLVICTVSTAIGFLVFVPTPYLGVAELGLIAGMGMMVIFFLTVTLFPALLITWLRFDVAKHIKHGLTFEANLGLWVKGHWRLVLSVALVLLVAGLLTAPIAKFDPNVIDMRDPSTESVQAFNDLLNASGPASPWYIDVMTPSLESAQSLAQQAALLKVVEQAVTIADFIPSEQPQKLALLQSLATQFQPIRAPSKAAQSSTAAQLAALKNLQIHLTHDSGQSDTQAFADKQRQLVTLLAALQAHVAANNDAALAELSATLVGDLPDQVSSLRTALDAESINLDSLPQSLSSRMLASSGAARVQIYPQENLRNEDHLRAFVTEIQSLAENAAGIAVHLIAFEEATKQSFKQALSSALLLITLLLIFIWRNAVDVLLVLGPLMLSLLLAVSCMVVLGLPFNFVNVIVIPLMFGIGVDSGIHLVQRSQATHADDLNLLNTTTARAVFYSALTTLVSFGSLSFSSHQGMRSLGILLAIGMGLTVLCNLIVLPALLEWRRRAWKWALLEQDSL